MEGNDSQPYRKKLACSKTTGEFMIIWWLVVGGLYIVALNCWGAGARYRIQKGPVSPDSGPGPMTPVWRMSRWLEPRGVRLIWWGNLALVAATILAYFASQQK